MMTTETIAIIAGIFLVVLILSLYIIFWFRDKQRPAVPQQPNQNLINLRLSAYERLVILSERISLPSLISRLPAGDMNVRQTQAVWIENIKHEFDYNLSQQIYVSKEVWQAVNNLREQNIFIINQMANTLPY